MRPAERFDPPVRRLAWRVPARRSLAELLADARARLADDERFESALWHGGLHVCGHPLRLEAAPQEVAAGSWIRLYVFEREPEPVPFGPGALLYEDAELVAVAKPAWLTMQGSHASQRLSLEAALRELLRAPRLAAVHRLDRQTSGVALFAKGPGAARALGRVFAERRARKRYLALVSPPPGEDAFEVKGAIVPAPHPRRPRFALAPEGAPGRASHARFRVLGRAGERALLLAEPTTGRTHQLRVQLSARGSPIVGDDLYGPPFRPGAASAAERVQLHAFQLALPATPGRPALLLEAPLPADLEVAGPPALVTCPVPQSPQVRGVAARWT